MNNIDHQEEEEEEDPEDTPSTATSAKPAKSDKDKDSANKESGREEGEGKSSKKKKAHSKTHPDLSAITYLGTGKVKAFTPEISASIPADMMASYGEGKTFKLAKNPDKVEGWIEHNKAHLRYQFHCIFLYYFCRSCFICVKIWFVEPFP